MQNFSTNPIEIYRSFWRNRTLIKSSIKHEFTGRYKGSMIGVLWSFLTPFFMLSIYTFVFGEIFKARWDHNNPPKAEFALILFAGLIIFNIFSECISRAPSLILNNPNYVKKVIFPLEILPLVALGTALFNAGVSLLVWLIAYFLLVETPHITFVFLPLLMIPLALMILGISWGLASLGVYIRDISQIIGLAITAMMFLSPIFYPATSISLNYRFLLYLNPLTPIIEQARDVMYWGKLPDLGIFSIYLILSCLIAWLGFAWFQKTRKGFADVL